MAYTRQNNNRVEIVLNEEDIKEALQSFLILKGISIFTLENTELNLLEGELELSIPCKEVAIL